MKLVVTPSRLAGSIAVPGSKSHTIRGIVAAILARGTSRLDAPLLSADTRSTLEAARLLGATVIEHDGFWEITGMGGQFRDPGCPIDLGNSGTGLNLLTAAVALQSFSATFDGDGSLRSRPMAGLLDPLAELGVEIRSSAGRCPFTLRGPVRGGEARVDGATSQFLTSLLFALPRVAGESRLTLEYLNEKPYIDITLQWLDRLGIRYSHTPDYLQWAIPGEQEFRAFRQTIPADFSTAAFPLAAAALAGDGVEIRNLDFSDAQGDKEIFRFFELMGARLRRDGELFVEPARSPLEGRVIDLNATPDALPVMAAAAALAHGETRLVNVAQARIKETDRIAVMALELGKMGANVTELPDGLVIQGGKLHGADVHSHGDHRIAMALAVAALAADSPTTIEEAEAANVTYPDFINDFRRLGALFSLL